MTVTISHWTLRPDIQYAECQLCGFVLDDAATPDGFEVRQLLEHQLECDDGRDVRAAIAESDRSALPTFMYTEEGVLRIDADGSATLLI